MPLPSSAEPWERYIKTPSCSERSLLCRWTRWSGNAKAGSCSLKDFKAEDRRQDVSAGAGRRRSPEETAGERIHTAYGIAGARGEAALGFPSVLTIGLPALKAWLSQGFSLNDAAVLTLLSLLSQVDDTNMIHRAD